MRKSVKIWVVILLAILGLGLGWVAYDLWLRMYLKERGLPKPFGIFKYDPLTSS